MKYFNLYSNILTTKGVTRTLISDLQRNVSELIPLEFFDVLELFKTNSIDDVFSQYDNESHVVLKEYLEFLLENIQILYYNHKYSCFLAILVGKCELEVV